MPYRHRRLMTYSIALAIVFAALYIGSEVYRARDYREHFIAEKGELARVTETLVTSGADHSLIELELENDHGIRVRGSLSVPKPTSNREASYPAVVILAGLRTGKKSLEFVKDPGDIILLALDYPYAGKVSKLSWWEFIVGLPSMRRAVLNTAPAVMLGVDYLCERKDVDQQRIVLVGGSVGALFAPAAASADDRIAAVALLFGAGDLRSLFKANFKLPAGLAGPAAWFCAVLTSPVEPLKYVDRVSPRPLLMINGYDDARMPERCTRLLYETAREPKTIRWFATGHVDIRSSDFHDKIRGELAAWLAENNLFRTDALRRSTASPPDPDFRADAAGPAVQTTSTH